MRLLLAASLVFVLGACAPIATPSPSTAEPTSSPAATLAIPASPTIPQATPVADPIAGGCGHTQAFAGPGPGAADQNLGGNPWASASPGIVAYFWRTAPYLRAGSVQSDGSSNKILWITTTGSTGAPLVIAAIRWVRPRRWCGSTSRAPVAIPRSSIFQRPAAGSSISRSVHRGQRSTYW